MKRYLSIDILRAVAILLMVQTHFVTNLSPRAASTSWLYDASCWFGLLPAPLFTLLSGLSFSLWMRKQEARAEATRRSPRSPCGEAFLFGAGIAFNVLIWLPEGTFNWDILTLIGASLVVLAAARKLPPPVLIAICVAVLLL